MRPPIRARPSRSAFAFGAVIEPTSIAISVIMSIFFMFNVLSVRIVLCELRRWDRRDYSLEIQ